jgi:hypothetical protein
VTMKFRACLLLCFSVISGALAFDITPDAAGLAKLEANQKRAKVAYLKSPKNPALKHLYAVASVRYGTACMVTDALDRKVKYAKALRLYREALKVEPANEEAKHNKDMIESVYRSMHRPIPK